MDAITFFLSRYGDLHTGLVDGLLAKLPEAHLRTRPHPGVNTVAWLLWHSARIEDLAVNRFLADRPQVLDDGWFERLAVARRDVGTGMSDAEVDDLSARIDLEALRGYWDAVTRPERSGSPSSGRRNEPAPGSWPRPPAPRLLSLLRGARRRRALGRAQPVRRPP